MCGLYKFWSNPIERERETPFDYYYVDINSPLDSESRGPSTKLNEDFSVGSSCRSLACLHSRSQSRFPFELSAPFICDIIAIIKEEEGTFRPKWITLNFNQFSIVFNSEQEKGWEEEGEREAAVGKEKKTATHGLRPSTRCWPSLHKIRCTSARRRFRLSNDLKIGERYYFIFTWLRNRNVAKLITFR